MTTLRLVSIYVLSLAAPLAVADTVDVPGSVHAPPPTLAPMPAAEPAPSPVPPAPVVAPAPATTASPSPASSDSSTLPGTGFPADRYEALWMKSPFAVATSESVGEESPDYLLVGIANFDGISYASVLDAKPPQEHFLISTDHPTLGMTLKTISHSADGANTYAVVEKDGQMLTLKLQEPPAGPAGATPGQGGPMPMNMGAPQIPMPGGTTPSVHPFTRFRRPPIRLPSMPQAAPTPPAPQPAPPPPTP